MALIDIPAVIAARSQQRFVIDARTISGGVPLRGSEQIITSPNALWRATITFMLRSSTDARYWNGFVGRLRGRARVARVPARCCLPVDLVARFGLVAGDERGLPHDPDVYFSGDVGYADYWPVFTLAQAIPAFGNVALLTVGNGMLPGFAVGDFLMIGGRMRRISDVQSPISATGAAVEFEPPVSSAVAAGALVPSQAYAALRLAGDVDGFADNEIAKGQTVSVDFIEVPGAA